MIDYDDYFGGLTEEEYVKQTEEHFKWLEENEMHRIKCCNANYCKHSNDSVHCDADDRTVEDCLYLKAISKITLLSMEITKSYYER